MSNPSSTIVQRVWKFLVKVSFLDIAQAYGPYEFWTENLTLDSNPDATWRALMVVAALKDPLFAESAKDWNQPRK